MGTRPLLVLCPLLVLIALIFVAPIDARADGKAFTRTSDNSAFQPANQEDQRAVIFFRDGQERLLITINYYANLDDQGLWIFPVPGTPETVHIDLWDTLPTFQGRDDRPWAREIANKTMLIMRASQIYPVPFDLAARAIGPKKKDEEEKPGEEDEAEVHEAVRKWGLEAQAVTAPSVEALAKHLRQSGIEIADDELRPFDPYLSGDYVLVIVRVASRAELDKKFGLSREAVWEPSRGMRRPCVLVEFPAERAYYPMRPTASYGDEHVPATIYILGHVRPQADARMLEYAQVHHFRDETADWRLEAFCGIAPRSVVDYTVVETRGPARLYASDFEFEPVQTSGFALAAFITDRHATYCLLAVLVFLAASCLSGAAAGAIAHIGTGKGALVGLLNVASIVGVILGAAAWIEQRRVVRFVTIFSLVFVVLTIIIHVVLIQSIAV